EVPDRAGRSVSCELLSPAAVPGSCRDFRQAFVAGLNLTADVTLVKNFTKTRRHPSRFLRPNCDQEDCVPAGVIALVRGRHPKVTVLQLRVDMGRKFRAYWGCRVRRHFVRLQEEQ